VNWLAFIIGLVAVVGAFLLDKGLSGLIAWLERRGFKLQQDMTDALRIGIQGAWDQLVRKLKADAADGKLSDEQKQQARDLAKKLALDVAKGPVLKALKSLAPEALDAVISLLVQRRKKEVETP
jgi:hypothetical protein